MCAYWDAALKDLDRPKRPHLAMIAELAVQATWMELARQRSGSAVLSHGLDYWATLHFSRTIKHQECKYRMCSILQNVVEAPVRAARANTGSSDCLHGDATKTSAAGVPSRTSTGSGSRTAPPLGGEDQGRYRTPLAKHRAAVLLKLRELHND